MAAMTNYLELQLANHILRNSAFSAPANLYIGLLKYYDSGLAEASDTQYYYLQEASGNGYLRASYGPGAAYWSAPGVDGVSQNLQDIQYTTATGNIGNISGVFIATAISGTTNILMHGAATNVRDIRSGDQYVIASGSIQVRFA